MHFSVARHASSASFSIPKEKRIDEALPLELLVHIFGFCELNPDVAFSLSRVSKKFNLITKQDELWEELLQRHFPLHALHLLQQPQQLARRQKRASVRNSCALAPIQVDEMQAEAIAAELEEIRKRQAEEQKLIDARDTPAGSSVVMISYRGSRQLLKDGKLKQEFRRLCSYGFDPALTNLKQLKLKYKNKRVSGITGNPKAYRTALTNQGFTTGKHLIEIKIEKLGEFFRPGIGITRKLSDQAIKRMDISLTSWCWFGALGLMYNQGKNYPPLPSSTPRFHAGDVIHLFLDIEGKSIQFACNGKKVGLEFSGAEEFEDNRMHVYRAVDEQTGNTVQEFFFCASLNGNKNKLRIVSRQQVPSRMNFEEALDFLKKAKGKRSAASQASSSQANKCIVM